MDPIKTRLFVSGDLSADTSIELDGDQAHYLRNVLRLSVGDAIALFNGRDGEWLARLDHVAKNRASAVAMDLRRAQTTEPDMWLVFAPVKRARIDFIAQKAAELGAARLSPIITERTIVDRVNTDRLLANATEAAEQCERLTVPAVDAPRKLAELLDQWPVERPLLMCDETGSGPPIGEVLSIGGPSRFSSAGLMIGPEGGFSKSELDRLHKLAFVTPVSLGPRLLRADTAALAALSCWQALAGDWLTARPRNVELAARPGSLVLAARLGSVKP